MVTPVPRTLAGQAGWSALLAAPATSLVALDYDGTLAPVVPRPEEARPLPGLAELLSSLPGRVALVSGREALALVDLAGLDTVEGLVVLGQYGVQRWEAGRLGQEEAHPGVAASRTEAARCAEDAGAVLEDKGHSLVVHTRRAANPAAALSGLLEPLAELAARTGLVLHAGRLVLELRPPGHDKGRALLSLADPLPTGVLYAGDDVGDLAAFDAVDELRGRGVPGLLVCAESGEAPAELLARADLIVPGPPGVVSLLRSLAEG